MPNKRETYYEISETKFNEYGGFNTCQMHIFIIRHNDNALIYIHSFMNDCQAVLMYDSQHSYSY